MPNEHEPTPEQMKEVMRSIQGRMRNIGFQHFQTIGARTFRILQDLDLASAPDERLGMNVDIEVLKDPQHSRREDLGPGPLILHQTDEDPPRRTVLELPMLVYSDSREIRAAALEEWNRYFESPVLNATHKTRSIVEKHRENLISEAPSKWRMASVEISDALKNDILIALAGTRQSLTCDPPLQESLNAFVPKVLFPYISSVESIQLKVGKGERERELLDELLKDTVDHSEGIESLCENYQQAMGFLPLASQYSLSAVMDQWLKAHAELKLWEEIWTWADQAGTPLAVYHACTVFVQNPEWIPDGKLDDLWDRILFVVDQMEAEEEEKSSSAETWVLRRELAKHYTYHFEAHLPEHDGSVIGVMAWWLAEQVAGLFPNDPESAQLNPESWVETALRQSTHVWITASASVLPSFLRFITMTSSCPWASALFTFIGEKMDRLNPGKLTDAQKSRFQGALVTSLLSSLPNSLQTPENPMYAQECSIEEVVRKWADLMDDENKVALHELVKMNRNLESREGLCTAIRKLKESSLIDQAAIGMFLKGKTLLDPSIAKGLWDIVSDSEWRREVLAILDPHIQGLLIEVFSGLMVNHGEEWFSQLPHFVAELCENEEAPDNRRTLFLLVLHLSMASDTVSAVHRLLRGDHKAKFIKHVDEYRRSAESHRHYYPPWVQGKLRALMASLYII